MNGSETYKMHKRGFIILVLLLAIQLAEGQGHPGLLMNNDVLAEMKSGTEMYPVWQEMVQSHLDEAEDIICAPIDVPAPKDPAGGYTHSQHKLNAKALNNLGIAYLLSGDLRYASYAKKVFLEYASLYPGLGLHPVEKSYAPGKLFWQQLNEAVWLVDAIQGYDAIYEYLSAEERKQIEGQLLKPFADFLSIENPHVFNRLHNHGVWAVAAVGMAGIAIGDDELVFRSLYGINAKGKPNRKGFDTDDISTLSSGFLAQTLSLFSPDGYYMEGPYYQRYAMTPFLLFAQSLDNNFPELDIMNFGDRIFISAVRILVDLADSQGRYFAINDNLKGMSLYSPESVVALCFLYAKSGDSSLLDILEEKSIPNIDANSLTVARDLSAGKSTKLIRSSRLIRDGAKGDEGGLALIRDEKDEFCALLKYASHGMGHGHFDRLNLIYYQGDNEILNDYGSVRFVNVKAKEGGRYLPENDSYAKQSVAHNTAVVNEESHFNGIYKKAQETHAELVYASLENTGAQFVCAKETNAYQDMELLRLSGLIQDEDFHHPLLIDLFRVSSETTNTSYDLPYHFEGDILNLGFDYTPFTGELQPLGTANGYQHLWNIAQGSTKADFASISWLDNSSIHTLSFARDEGTELRLVRSGANDPAFNMRLEPALIIRERNKKDHLFASVLEVHGEQNESTEMVSNQDPAILGITAIDPGNGYLGVKFETAAKQYLFLSVATKDKQEDSHHLTVEGKVYSWIGNYTLIKTIK